MHFYQIVSCVLHVFCSSVLLVYFGASVFNEASRVSSEIIFFNLLKIKADVL